MPPTHQLQKDTAKTPAPGPLPATKANPSSSAALRKKIGNEGMRALAEKQMLAGLKAQSPLIPDWMLRAVVISKSEEQRSRQEWQKDGLKGGEAGHNDIYDAERHARWMYRLTREVSLWAGRAIGDLKEMWGQLKGAGGAETAMDLHNNEIGRKAALAQQPIPDRHTTRELIFIDPTTGKARSNAERLSVIRAQARGKATAAAAAGAAAARVALSGASRWTWDQSSGSLSRDGAVVGSGYAGHGEGKNNPEMQNVRKVGPIPAGLWRMVAVKDSPKTGAFTIVLEPEPGTNTLGRSEFRVHGDSRRAPGTASEGCIILPRTIREQMWGSRNKAPLIEVVE